MTAIAINPNDRYAFPGLPTDPDNPIALSICVMNADDAYEAGFSDRTNGLPRRATRNNAGIAGVDYDLGWRDAAPGGHGHRDGAAEKTAPTPLCADCGQPFRQEPSGCAGHGCQQPVPDHDRKVALGFLSACAAASCSHAA